MGGRVLGRNAVAGIRKLGAGAERRRAIDAETHEANALSIFEAMSGMKGAFMKLGQMLSQQAHSLPEPYVRKLAGLQWEAPPMHGTLMRRQVRNELGRAPEEIFESFDPEPFAAASLGQVHHARLPGSGPLAVKIQYPGIDRSIDSDFANFKALLNTIRLNRAQFGEIWEAVDEVRRHFHREVDYVHEAGTMEEFATLLRDRKDVVIPGVHRKYSTRRILVMDHLEGRHLKEWLRTKPSQRERDEAGRLLLDLFFRQSLGFSLLHADPHPGNYLFMEGGRIGLLDFGCAKRFDRGFMEEHRSLFRIRIGDGAALDHHYRKFRFYDGDDALADRKREALMEMQRVDIAKYHQDRLFNFGDPAHLKSLWTNLRNLLKLGLTTPEFVLYVRAKLGLYSLLQAMNARVNCNAVLRRYV